MLFSDVMLTQTELIVYFQFQNSILWEASPVLPLLHTHNSFHLPTSLTHSFERCCLWHRHNSIFPFPRLILLRGFPSAVVGKDWTHPTPISWTLLWEACQMLPLALAKLTPYFHFLNSHFWEASPMLLLVRTEHTLLLLFPELTPMLPLVLIKLTHSFYFPKSRFWQFPQCCLWLR